MPITPVKNAPPGYVGLEAYLVFNKTTITKMAKSTPKLEANERMCKVRLEVPLAVFETPQFSITIKFDGETVPFKAETVLAQVQGMLEGSGINANVVPLFGPGKTACEDCDGTGQVDLLAGNGPLPCTACGGTGAVKKAG